MDNIDTNIDAYDIDELYDLVNLSNSSTKEEIEQQFLKLIQNNMESNNYMLAQFFHNAKEKVIANLNNTNGTNSTNGTNGTNQLNPNNIKKTHQSITINSRDRPNQIPLITNPAKLNSSVNFIINLTQPLTNVLSMKLKSVNIQNSIMTLDPIYSNNSLYLYISDVVSSTGVPNFDNSIPTKINITPGIYTNSIDFINQINIDLSYCVPQQLKSGTTSNQVGPPYSGSLLLYAHLIAPLTKTPRIVFINSSDYYIKIVFYELKERNSNLPSVGVLENDENPCYIKSVYNNNLGYFMGYRVYQQLDGTITNYIETIINKVKYTEFGIILYKVPSDNKVNIQQKLIYIYNKLAVFELEYSLALYTEDIFSFIDIILNPNKDNKYYSISSVPLSLASTKYVYLCINDFQNNRETGSIIRISDPITKIYPLPEYVNKLTNYPQDNNTDVIDINADIYCDSTTKTKVYVPSYPRKITQNQLYSLNAILQDNRKNRTNINDNTITDVLATLAVDPSEDNILTFTDHMPRVYFGPVRIEKLEIKLKDDLGNFVNLNGTDWGFSIEVEQLYQTSNFQSLN